MLLFRLPAQGAIPPATADVPWHQLEFQASKLFVSGKLQFELTELPADQARAQLLSVSQQQPLNPRTATVSLLLVRSELMSNRGEMRIWMDPRDFRVYQRARMTTGSNTRLKLYRYLQSAVYRVRKESESSELQFESSRWRTSSEQVIPLLADSSGSTAMHDPSALLLLASNSALSKTGDSITTKVFTDKQFYEATLKVTGSKRIDAKYRLDDYSGSRNVAAKLDTLRIELSTKLVSAAPEEEAFEFLGLNGPIVIHMDPKSRLPLQVQGRQRRVGKITVDLRKVRLQAQ
ncbi:MAG: DUF3108 domain-containing protein [Pseudomonadales bacterium]